MSPVLVRELRPGSWYLVIRYKGRKYVRKVSESKKQAEKIAKDLNKELQFRGYGALDAFKPSGKPLGLTVSGYADRWLEDLRKSGLKPSTINSYESNIRLHIKPHFGDLPLLDVTYGRVKEFISDRIEQPYIYGSRKKENRPERPYSRDSIRLMVATLRAMLEEAVREELLEANPVHGLGKFYSAAKKLREEPDPFSLAELHALEVMAAQWQPLILFQSRTGARIGEAIALKWEDVDFREFKARIRRTMPANRQIGTPKSLSSNRSVELSPELMEALRAHQAKIRKTWFAKGMELPEWVFPTRAGEVQNYNNFRRAYMRLQRLAKIRIRRVHDLRHTWACHQLAAGKPITWVSSQLGHKNPQITLAIYARWVPGADSGRNDVLDKEPTTRQQTATGEGERL